MHTVVGHNSEIGAHVRSNLFYFIYCILKEKFDFRRIQTIQNLNQNVQTDLSLEYGSGFELFPKTDPDEEWSKNLKL